MQKIDHLKILYYTEGEGCQWKKFPLALTYKEFVNLDDLTLKKARAYSEPMQIEVEGLCIFIKGVQVYKFVLQNGFVFSAYFHPLQMLPDDYMNKLANWTNTNNYLK